VLTGLGVKVADGVVRVAGRDDGVLLAALVEFIASVVADPEIMVEFMPADMLAEARRTHYKLGTIQIRNLLDFF
jgi:hypothetical protein